MSVAAKPTDSAPTAPTTAAAAPFSPGYRRYVLGLLFVVYVFNFLDRQILSILLEPIKRDLGLSDTQLGFLSGIAFALFYTIVGLPIARWADRASRRNIIALALAVWSGMTALCGLAQNFWQLALARVGVGVGEAGCSPPSHSLLSDYYARSERATALSVYSLGIPVGILLGFLLGGWITEFFGWRWAFVVVGLPGLLLAVVVRFTLREAPRGFSDGVSAPQTPLPVREVIRALWSQPSFRHLTLAISLNAFTGYGATVWLPAFLLRVHGMSPGEVGTALALVIGVAGGCGTYAAGVIADRLGRRDQRWFLWTPALAVTVATPFALGIYLWPGAAGALIFAAISTFFNSFYLGPSFSTAQSLVDPRMRAIASAIMMLFINLIGMGLGPQIVGILSDLLTPRFGLESLRYALLVVALFKIWSVTHYALASRSLRQDLAARDAALAAAESRS